MEIRNNKLFELAIKRGIEISKYQNNYAAKKLMTRVGVPLEIITRVLFEPHLIRTTDLNLYRRLE